MQICTTQDGIGLTEIEQQVQIQIAKGVMRIFIFAWGTALCNSGKSLLDREKGILVRSAVVCKKIQLQMNSIDQVCVLSTCGDLHDVELERENRKF